MTVTNQPRRRARRPRPWLIITIVAAYNAAEIYAILHLYLLQGAH